MKKYLSAWNESDNQLFQLMQLYLLLPAHMVSDCCLSLQDEGRAGQEFFSSRAHI